MKDNFDKSLQFVLAREGGKVNDPNDRGGKTNMGITQNTYDDWRFSKGQVKKDVWLMTEDEASSIYLSLYWHKVHGDDMPDPVDLVLFDSAVQHGPRDAAVFLQSALGVQADGIIGPLTIQQVARVAASELAADIIIERVNFYRHIIESDPSQKRFEKGWGNRIAQLCEAAGIQDNESV